MQPLYVADIATGSLYMRRVELAYHYCRRDLIRNWSLPRYFLEFADVKYDIRFHREQAFQEESATTVWSETQFTSTSIETGCRDVSPARKSSRRSYKTAIDLHEEA